MELNVDVNEMEQQRYNRIKKSGKYVEVNVLVGTEREEFKGHTGIVPVVTTMAHGCGAKEIGCAYLTLKELTKAFEQNYPAECFLANTLMNSQAIGSIDVNQEKEED